MVRFVVDRAGESEGESVGPELRSIDESLLTPNLKMNETFEEQNSFE